MAVGFIQLIFAGNEQNIFNKDPNITFFKIYYRRHTNFYINNYIVEGNETKHDKLISFNIPMGGDLLFKNYLYIDYQEHYFELFEDYKNLYNTLNTKIVDFFDSYSVKTISFIKQDINSLEKVKINLQFNQKIYLSLFCNYNPNNDTYIETLKNEINLYLQSNSSNFFYNINKHYEFYSFIYENNNLSSPYNIPSTSIILNSIDYSKIQLLRVDINHINISIKIYNYNTNNTNFIKDIVNYFITNTNNNDNNTMSVAEDNIYVSFSNNNTIVNTIKKYVIDNSEILKINAILDKTSNHVAFFYKNENNDKYIQSINDLFKISKNYIVYLDIFIENGNANIIITLMKFSSFLGNLILQDYNDFLIKKETEIVTSTNLSTTKISTNLFIKLIILMVCIKNDPTIENFTKIINKDDFSYTSVINYYSNNLNLLYQKLLNVIMIDRPLILNNINLLKIFYAFNVKKLYKNYSLNMNSPLTNQLLIDFSHIINYYFYLNCIKNFASNTTSPDNKLITLKSILQVINNTGINIENYTNFYKNNYLYLDSNGETISFNNTSIDNKISDNIFQFIIYSAINITKDIIYKRSFDLYKNNGYQTSLFDSKQIETAIFPMSGMLYLNLQNSVDKNINEYIFTNTYNLYMNRFLNIQNAMFNKLFQKYKTNPNDTLKNNFKLSLHYNQFDAIISRYYDTYTQYFKNIEFHLIDNFLSMINIGNVSETNIALNEYFIENIYLYTNTHLFNGSFFEIYNNLSGSFDFNKLKKFIFLQNSPLYRIFYSIIFLEKFKTEKNATGDIVTLINFTVDFLITFIEYFHKNNTFTNKNNFNFSKIFNSSYLIENNFCCYGNINFLNESSFVDFVKKNDSVTIYSSYYLLKLLNVNGNTSDSEGYLDNINNFINASKKSYDDIIIVLYLETLYDNKIFFEKYNLANATMNLIFNKNNFSFKQIISSLYSLSDIDLNENNNRTFVETNDNFFYLSYYTIFYLGNLFDNVNSFILRTLIIFLFLVFLKISLSLIITRLNPFNSPEYSLMYFSFLMNIFSSLY